VQRGFVSIILALIAISLGVGAAMHADNPTVRVLLIVGVSSLALIVIVWLLAWCLPSMFGEWRKLAVPPGSCPNCGFEVRAGEERCPECDHRLTLFTVLRGEEEAAPGEDAQEQAGAAEAGAEAETTEKAGATVEASSI
jgi:hypothetical protein